MRLTIGRAATPGARLARGSVGVAKPRLTSLTDRKGAQIGSSSRIVIIILTFVVQNAKNR